MATDFGFLPSNEDGAYFISYNSEDSARVAPIARELNAQSLPLWYDYGLEYGEEWKRQIAAHIHTCNAVLMFITKNLFLRKKRSYVYKEYRMAEMCDKKVYVVMMDKISKQDVPEELWDWWIDLTDLHCIDNATANGIMQALGRSIKQYASTNSNNTIKMSASELNSKGNDYYLKQDYDEAVRYYKLAAEQGSMHMRNIFLVAAINMDEA